MSTSFKTAMPLEPSFCAFLMKSTWPVQRVCLYSLVFCFPSGDSIHPHFTIGYWTTCLKSFLHECHNSTKETLANNNIISQLLSLQKNCVIWQKWEGAGPSGLLATSLYVYMSVLLKKTLQSP